MNEFVESELTRLAIATITANPEVQPRVELDSFVIDEYAQAMAQGAQFPPVVVFLDGATWWLADGFHRVAAAKEVSLDAIEAEVHEGGLRDAILYAVGANATHGKRRSNADKRRAVITLLQDAEWSAWSDRRIAERVVVSHSLVSKLRAELSVHGGQMPVRRVDRSGQVYTMSTGAIGRRGQLDPEARELLRETEVADDRRQVARLATRPEEIQVRAAEKIASGEAKSVEDALRKLTYQGKAIVSLAQVASGRFPVIYADPPWRFDSGDGLKGSAAEEYPTMALEDIRALPVIEKTTEDAVIFLWSTNAHLPDALGVLAAWGFKYQANIAWIKNTFGVGFYVRGKHELLLIGVRGSLIPKVAVPSVLEAPARGHSVKPDEVYDLIERMYPGMRYLELFARRRPARANWEAWGNEPELAPGAPS